MERPSGDVYGPCPCGSGQKYKFCCLQRDRERRRLIESADPVEFDGVQVIDFDYAREAHERGLRLLEQDDPEEAIRCFEICRRETPMMPSPYNNLALARYSMGDFAGAIECAEQVDRAVDPGNVFALGMLVQAYLAVGRRRDAEAIVLRLRGLSGRDEFATVKKCEALARFRLHDQVLAVALEGLPRARECAGDIGYFAGVACANLARYDDAASHLRRAVSARTHYDRARKFLDLIQRRQAPDTLDGDWPYLRPIDWAPRNPFEQWSRGGAIPKHPGLVESLVCVVNEGAAPAGTAVTALRTIGTPEARDVLRRIAFGVFGDDDLRMSALTALLELGEIPEGAPATIWHRGRWRAIRPMSQEIRGDRPTPLPESLRGRMADMLEALHAGASKKAERIGREMLARAPDAPSVLQNLSQALSLQGRKEEAEGLLRRAMQVDPGYLFAPSALALTMAEDGRTEAARAMLDNVKIPKAVHPDAYALYLIARSRLAMAEGDFERAHASWRCAERLAPDSMSVLMAAESWAGRLMKFSNDTKTLALRRASRYERRLLPPDPTAADCLAEYDRPRLASVAGTPLLKRDELMRRAIAALGDPARVRAAVDALPPDAARALLEVVDAGGVIEFAAFTRRWAATEEKDDGPRYDAPGTPIGRLLASGLLAVGAVGARPSVVVPREVRAALAASGGSAAAVPQIGAPAPVSPPTP